MVVNYTQASIKLDLIFTALFSPFLIPSQEEESSMGSITDCYSSLPFMLMMMTMVVLIKTIYCLFLFGIDVVFS